MGDDTNQTQDAHPSSSGQKKGPLSEELAPAKLTAWGVSGPQVISRRVVLLRIGLGDTTTTFGIGNRIVEVGLQSSCPFQLLGPDRQEPTNQLLRDI